MWVAGLCRILWFPWLGAPFSTLVWPLCCSLKVACFIIFSMAFSQFERVSFLKQVIEMLHVPLNHFLIDKTSKHLKSQMHFRSFRKHLRDVWARRPRKQTCIRTSHGAQRLSITRPTCILAAVKGFRCIWVKGCQNNGFLRIWIWPPRSTLQLFASYLPQSWERHAILGEEARKRTLLAWYCILEKLLKVIV